MPTRATSGRQASLWVASLMALGLAHALAVAPHYHFGSFDDDASYVLVAKALASGVGLTGNLWSGHPLVGAYPPAFGALLSPIALVAPGAILLYRIPPLLFFASIFPLTWVWLERLDVPVSIRVATLVLLALNPVLATFATMVMPETAFVVVFLLLLVTAQRWGDDARVVSWMGAGTVLLAAGLLWLKEAAFGLLIGLGCWLLLRRAWKKAAVAVIGPALLLAPVLIARAVVGAPLIGSRYSTDLGVTTGGFLHRVVHVVPNSLSAMVESALPASVVPTGVSPLPTHGAIGLVLDLVDWTLPALVALGFLYWIKKHRELTALVVGAYLLETLAYPFMNERRFVLVLPVIVVWYVLGVKQAILALTWARDRLSRRSRAVGRGTATTVGRLVGAGAAMVLVGAPLVAQFPRDYLFKFGQDSSTPHGSPYMNLLHQLGGSRDVVETTYLWTTALLTGHRTASAVYRAPCDDPSVRGAVVVDRASYMLDAALNKPGQVESGCLLQVATASTWVIPLLHTSRDEASVFELIGPGTAHPDRVDLVSGQPVIDSSYLRWTWSRPVEVKQVTLGSGAGRVHPERGLTIELRLFNGDWVTVASSPGRVGDGARTRFLAVELPEMLVVTEVRITAGGEPPALKDFHVLGSNSP